MKAVLLTPERRRILMYVVVGIVNTTVSGIVLHLGTRAGLSQTAAGTIAFVVGGVCGYLGHTHFTFRAQMSPAAFHRFLHVNAFSLCINTLVIRLLLEPRHLSDLAIILITSTFNPVLGYLSHRFYTYADRSRA